MKDVTNSGNDLQDLKQNSVNIVGSISEKTIFPIEKSDWQWWYNAEVLRVIDGDSVELAIDLGFDISIKHSIRLAGIDAPETFGVKKTSLEYQTGLKSKNWLKDKLEGKKVIFLSIKDRDEKYGRFLGKIYLDGKEINQEMLDLGMAKAYM